MRPQPHVVDPTNKKLPHNSVGNRKTKTEMVHLLPEEETRNTQHPFPAFRAAFQFHSIPRAASNDFVIRERGGCITTFLIKTWSRPERMGLSLFRAAASSLPSHFPGLVNCPFGHLSPSFLRGTQTLQLIKSAKDH